MHIYKLKDMIESIKYGPHTQTQELGEVKYLKGKAFGDDYGLDQFKNSYVKLAEGQEKHLLKENDILVAGKGYRNFAWKYENEEGPCIASSTFYVIKVKEDVVMPEYFVLLINSPKVQHELRLLGLGPVTPSIPKGELLNVETTLPPLEDQRKATEIYKSIKTQIKLQRQILEKKILLKNGLLDLITTKQMLTNKKVL